MASRIADIGESRNQCSSQTPLLICGRLQVDTRHCGGFLSSGLGGHIHTTPYRNHAYVVCVPPTYMHYGDSTLTTHFGPGVNPQRKGTFTCTWTHLDQNTLGTGTRCHFEPPSSESFGPGVFFAHKSRG